MLPQEMSRGKQILGKVEVPMTIGEETPLGGIRISLQAIRSLASQAALRSYGVVGLAERGWFESWMHPIAKDPRRGVDVTRNKNGGVDLDVYIIVEYGTRIATVAESVAESVRFLVERDMDIPLDAVHIHVQGLRVSNID
jgi:uncharacterized alkaline shock family protein YloU